MKSENNLQNIDNENEELVKKSKKVVKKLIIFYIIMSVICMFLIQFKEVAIIISLLQIGIALYFYNRSKGIIIIDYNAKSSQPGLFFPLLIPIITLFAIGIIEITILDYSMFWAPFTMFLLIFMWVIIKLINKNEVKRNYQSFIISFLLGAAFSFGFTIDTNEVFKLKTEHYNAQILDKWIIESRNTTCHFMLTPGGPMKDTNCIKVFQSEYDKYQPGDSVTIEYNLGLYRIPFLKLIDK